jgi:hypothetical protein
VSGRAEEGAVDHARDRTRTRSTSIVAGSVAGSGAFPGPTAADRELDQQAGGLARPSKSSKKSTVGSVAGTDGRVRAGDDAVGMKRSPELAALSHDHHHALDVARRLRRASDEDLGEVVAYLDEFWRTQGAEHFAQEERALVPGLVDSDAWRDGVARMLAEHETIRAGVATVEDVDAAHALGDLLHDHVRFEERELFGLLEASASGLIQYRAAAWETSTYTSS